MDDLRDLNRWASGFLEQIQPAARRTLARQIAMVLRKRNQDRIAAQTGPDGTAYAPRRPQLRLKSGRIRRKMFAKLRTNRFLQAKGDANAAMVEFAGAVQRIARVHHYGLRDRVGRGSLEVEYPARELLGVPDSDEQLVADLVLEHLAKR